MFSGCAQLDAVCRLVAMFISNVEISGYAVTATVHSKVDALLALTSQHVLELLHDKCIKLVHSHASSSPSVPPMFCLSFYICICMLWSLVGIGYITMLLVLD